MCTHRQVHRHTDFIFPPKNVLDKEKDHGVPTAQVKWCFFQCHCLCFLLQRRLRETITPLTWPPICRELVNVKTSGVWWVLPSKIKKTGFPRVLSNLRRFKQNISSSSKLLSGHTQKKAIFKTKTFSWKVSKHCFCQIWSYARGRTEYLWHICWNWRNCVSGMVREEECSNLSLLSGVRKHTEEVMKNSPKQEESDLVSLPWGLLSSLREGEGKEGKARKKNEQTKTGGFGFFSFQICEGFCRDIKIKKREIGSKRLSRFACSRK